MKGLSRRLGRLLLLLLAGVALFLALGFWTATRDPVVVRMAAELPGLPPGEPLRLVLMSDTHAGSWDTPVSRLRRVVAQVNALEPDLVLLAGDYFAVHLVGQPPDTALGRMLAPLADLSAPLGVYAVQGNHDNQWTVRLLGRQGKPRLLVNRWADAGPLVIAGLDSASHSPDVNATLGGIPADRPVLLLLHEPEHLKWIRRPGQPRHILALAGHTHGGQVWFGRLGSPMEWHQGTFPCRRGACRVNGWDVIVTSGIGTSTLPVRIGVRPEIVELTLYSSTGRKSGTER